MIGWDDVYKVIVAMVPLYVALTLGYGSVRWWRVFTTEQCGAINRLVCYFTLPLFAFEFTAHIDPFHMNYRFVAADAVSKLIIVLVLGLWARSRPKEDGTSSRYSWSITSYSLSTLTNSLVVGVPLMRAMYGPVGVDIVVQGSVVQAIVWLTLLLFVLEFRRTGLDCGGGGVVVVPAKGGGKDLEGGGGNVDGGGVAGEEEVVAVVVGRMPFWGLMKVVWVKLASNPNSYACIIGLAWAFVSNRWHIEMPSIVDGSVSIMAKAGTGTAMFSMGIFMAMQEKLIACGPTLTVVGMVLRFVAGPAAMAIASIVVGLHGDVLRVAIIQAALPQSITSFIFAKEYGLHAEVLSTAVIFGMIVSLPVLIGYYAVLEFAH